LMATVDDGTFIRVNRQKWISFMRLRIAQNYSRGDGEFDSQS
jgi:hypothetical protein